MKRKTRITEELCHFIDDITPMCRFVFNQMKPGMRRTFSTLCLLRVERTASEVATYSRTSVGLASANLCRLVRKGYVECMKVNRGLSKYSPKNKELAAWFIMRTEGVESLDNACLSKSVSDVNNELSALVKG